MGRDPPLNTGLDQCRSNQNFYTGQDLKKKMKSAMFFFQYLSPNSLFAPNSQSI